MNIYIPSTQRQHKQTTLANLPEEIHKSVIVVVPPDELTNYVNVLKYQHAEVRVVAPDIPSGIGHTRQWCCDQEKLVCIMLDDDLTFADRRRDDPTKFVDASTTNIKLALETMHHRLLTGEYSHIGIAPREGGNRRTEAFSPNTRLLRALGYRTDVMRELGIRFDDMEVMEDFYVSLSLLTAGTKNCNVNWMVQNQNGSGLQGGCSTYRTMEVQARAAGQLAEKFPEFVQVVEKTTSTAWGKGGATRKDVRIQWKKAYQSSQNSSTG